MTTEMFGNDPEVLHKACLMIIHEYIKNRKMRNNETEIKAYEYAKKILKEINEIKNVTRMDSQNIS